MQKRSVIWFAVFHAAMALAVLLFPFYRIGSIFFSAFFSGCAIHDLLHLYCPLCGGTRAASALLRFDLPGAFRFQPAVVILVGVGLVYYILAWVRLFQKKPLLAPLPRALSIAMLVLVFGYCVVRNVLLVFFGIDPAGDLLPFWNGN